MLGATKNKIFQQSFAKLKGEQRTAAFNALIATNSAEEASGVAYGIKRMQANGYSLFDKTFQYRGSQGIDLVFKNNKSGKFAILEAKNNPSLGSLSKDTRGLRQGGHDYNIDRVQQYINYNPTDIEAIRLLQQLRANNVDSFASFNRSNKLYQLDFRGQPNFKTGNFGRLIDD